MSQTWSFPLAATASLAAMIQAMNDGMAALRSNFSGTTAPADAVAGQLWFKSDTGDTYQRNAADDDWSLVLASAGGGSIVPGTPVLRLLDGSGFDGVETSFAGLLPVEPEVDDNVVVLIQAGVGPLKMVASSPGADEFALSGATNQDVEFGTPPASGDEIYAVYVAA
jgi:hypothetical protein